MDDRYNSYFFNTFYAENGGGNYTDKEKWMPFFSMIADRLIEMFDPKTVLDAGCATGYLVEALRKKGVDAYGIDISAYAINMADDSIKPYVAVHSITEKLPKGFPDKFDVITTIEVLEHLFPEDGKKAIANLCSYSDTIIFTSTPDDVEDRTHCNVQLQEYWCKEFAANSFYHDLLQPMDFICPWAMLFRKKDNFENVIFDYEMNRRIDKLFYKKANEQCAAVVYFDLGNGFSEENISHIVYNKNSIACVKFDLPLGCVNVRLDPIDKEYALVKIYDAASDRGVVELLPVGGKKLGGVFLFDNDDSQFLINIKENTKWIKINWFVYAFDSIEMVDAFAKINEEKEKAENTINDYILKTDELSFANNALRKNIEELEGRCSSLNDEKHRALSLVSDKNNIIKKLNYEKDYINSQLIKCNEANNALVNSTCWKITKPLRNAVELLRSFNLKSAASRLYKGNTPYSIDCSKYENCVYNLKGWIFNLNKETDYIKLIIEGGGKKFVVEEGLFKIARNDVYGVYQNKFAKKPGFEFSCLVSVQGTFRAVLEYKCGNNIKHINCGSFKGETAKGKKNEVISIINSGIPDNIEKVIDDLYNNDEEDYGEVYKREYDIIIPVYNGYKYLDKLFSSLVRTKAKFNLIIINDCSTDERVSSLLKEYASKIENTRLIEHTENKGFVKTVNEGLNIAKNDAVILNTDVETPELWLERLMLPIVKHKDIASVTPFTNSGTICSFPEFLKDNDLFMGGSVDEIDNAFRNIKPFYASAPTGVGFCMAMSKAALDKVGLLDDETFVKGYGEENDWCQRAIKNGFRNVIAENIFVYHNHGGSFNSDEKKALIERNNRALLNKHPDYSRDVALYCSENPHRRIRNFAGVMACLNICKKVCIIFNHNLGGGATSYLKGYITDTLNDENAAAVVTYDNSRGIYYLRFYFDDFKCEYIFNDLDHIKKLSNIIHPDFVVINELVTYPNIFETLQTILEFVKINNAELTYLMHDYYCICPSVNLMDSYGEYCGAQTDCSVCGRCLKNNKNISICSDMDNWRRNWKVFLERCDKITVFSDSSKEICQKVFGELPNIVVKPHRVEYLPNIWKKNKTTDTLNIGILGVLCKHKGLDIIEEILKEADRRALNIKIVVIGTSDKVFNSKRFVVTGRYTYDELPRLALENDIDVFFISSIWPETFSYTAEEAMKMGYPVMSFNIGAPAERIKKYDKGCIVPEMNWASALETAMKTELLPVVKNKRVLFVTDYVSFSSRYRVEHFMEELLLNGIKSDFMEADNIYKADLTQYNSIVIYRCKYTNIIDDFIKSAHNINIKVYFDVDDLVFDYERISYLDFIKDQEYSDFKEYTASINKTMSLCDGFITSTECLKNEIEKVFPNKPVCVNRNVISLEMLAISNKVRLNKRNNKNKVVLGYFSGSKTHNKDFELISDILLRLLEENDNLYIKIGGVLDIDRRFEKYSRRIITFDFCDWKNLPEIIGSVDINLMPLEQSIFHECKSENKWTEAAAVEVCTVGSYNDELSIMIKTGYNGFLCKTKEQWYDTLDRLIKDKALRCKTAENAYNTVIEKSTVISADRKAQKFILMD